MTSQRNFICLLKSSSSSSNFSLWEIKLESDWHSQETFGPEIMNGEQRNVLPNDDTMYVENRDKTVHRRGEGGGTSQYPVQCKS